MELKINIKPRKIVASNKSDILNKVSTRSYMVSNHGNSHISANEKNAVVVNYVKFNKKTKQTKKAGVTTSKIIREKHWVGYVYEIPIDLLNLMNIKVSQKTRHFLIEKRK